MTDTTPQTTDGGATASDAHTENDVSLENNGVAPAGAADSASDYDDGSEFAINMSVDDEANLRNILSEDKEQEGQQDESYALAFDEQLNVSDQVRSMYTELAQKSGLPAKAASEFLNSAIAGFNDLNKKALKEQREMLKKEWGHDYERNVQKTNGFIKRIATREGFTQAEVDALCTPLGYRLLYGFFKNVGESRAPMPKEQGTAPSKTPKEQMHDMLRNKDNPFHNGLTNPHAPIKERRAAYEEYNRLAGMPIYSL